MDMDTTGQIKRPDPQGHHKCQMHSKGILPKMAETFRFFRIYNKLPTYNIHSIHDILRFPFVQEEEEAVDVEDDESDE